MKVFVRAKVWAAINALRGQQTAPGRTPLQAAEERVEAAKQALNRCEQALAEAEGLRLDAQRLTILIGTYCRRCLDSHGFCSVDVTTVAVSVPRALHGTVGFGTFGQFLAKKFAAHNHTVIASSRTDYTELAAAMGVIYCKTADQAIREVRYVSI